MYSLIGNVKLIKIIVIDIKRSSNSVKRYGLVYLKLLTRFRIGFMSNHSNYKINYK